MQPIAKSQIQSLRLYRIYSLLWVLLMVLIVLLYLLVKQQLHRQVEETMSQRMRTQVMVLREHATQTLDTVQSRVTRLLLLETKGALPQLSQMQDMIRDIPVVRGISLVDEQGKVVSSSDPRRVGQVLRRDVMSLSEIGAKPGEASITQLAETDPFETRASSVATGSRVLWLAGTPLSILGREQRWIMALDVEMLRRLWTTVGQYTGALVGLYGPLGQPWVSSGNPEEVQQALVHALAPDRRPSSEEFTLQTPLGTWRAQYRTDPGGRWLLAVAVDERQLTDRIASLDGQLLRAALLAALGVSLVVFLVFLWQRHLERPMIEAARHSLALSEHMMVAESNVLGEIVWANQALLDRTGYSEQELVGQNNRIFNSQTNTRHFYEQLWKTIQAGQVWKGTFRNRTKSGEQFWVNATIVPFRNALGQVSSFVTMYSDVTEAMLLSRRLDNERRQRAELEALNRHLQDSAYRDPLTGTLNRRGFSRYCSKAIKGSEELGNPVSLLMLDIDRFKNVNDEHGHAAGDEVLRELCRRWSQQIRGSDLLVRLGGEEFCVVLPNAGAPEALRVADKIRQATADEPIHWADQGLVMSMAVTLSIGVACTGPQAPYLSIEQLQAQADRALYRAKSQGRNQVVLA